MAHEQLSPLDGLFLDLESDVQPMHVGALAVLEGRPLRDEHGRIRLAAIRHEIERRLHMVPKFRRRLFSAPFGAARPVWVDDHEFDIANHIALDSIDPPGGRGEVLDAMARLQRPMLDRSRPLWNFWFLDGHAHDPADADPRDRPLVMVFKAHHCLLDGVSGIEVAMALLDFEPEAVRPDPPDWHPSPPPLATDLFLEGVAQVIDGAAAGLRTVAAGIRHPDTIADRAGQAAGVLGDLVSAPHRFPWNAPISGARRFATAAVDLDLLNRVRHEHGVKLNDAVLAVVAGGVRRYLEGSDVDLDGSAELRVIVPSSVRGEDERLALGNRVTVMMVSVPLEPDADGSTVAEIGRRMKRAKDSDQQELAAAAIDLGEKVPPAIIGPIARTLVQRRAANVVVTNIPGPDAPLYCVGARVLEVQPYVGIFDGQGLTVAVISYQGRLGFGLVADPDVLPDLASLAEAIEHEAAALGE